MKRIHGVLAGVLWIALQNGLLAQGPVHPGSLHPAQPDDSLVRHQTGKDLNEGSVLGCCEKLAGDNRRIYFLTDWSYGIVLQLNGVYSRAGMLFLKILLINHSGIDYGIDSLRFVIRDDHYETGEGRLIPIYIYGNAKTVKAQSRELYVFALPKFALPDKKHLDFELLEKKGGRNLRLKMGKRPLIHARFI